jgi:hypothetical protein
VAGVTDDAEWKPPSPESVTGRIKTVLGTLSPQARQHPKLSELLQFDVAELCPPRLAGSATESETNQTGRERMT